jgi:hypothetical protein
MKKHTMVLGIMLLLVVALAGTSYAWQGRMGGMGDPYGLVADESDFLIHPAKIADGQGTRLYGDYRFTYRGVPDWNYKLNWFTPFGAYMGSELYDTSGHDQQHDALVGVAFPVGAGRMGILFQYDGMRGDYDGTGYDTTLVTPLSSDLASRVDAFTLSLLYGLPIGGGFKLGGEAQLAYRQEKNEESLQAPGLVASLLNNPMGSYNLLFPPTSFNLLPFMRPYDSSYLEALFKGSLEGAIGPLETAFTMRGGVIFAGDNQLKFLFTSGGAPIYGADVNGGVQGWQIGGDLWARYPLAKGFTIPFLVRVDYQDKTRDASGWGAFSWVFNDVSYESNEKALNIEAGGGIDTTELVKGWRLAGGVYYNYLNSTNDFLYQIAPLFNWTFDQGQCPDSTEHQVELRLAGEHELSSAFTLRAGLNFFYGWVTQDYGQSATAPAPNRDDLSLTGSHWGIGASVGGSFKLQRLTFEPFVGAGYQAYGLSGDGETTLGGVLFNSDTMDKTQKEWFVGGGLSVLLGL